MYTVSKFDIVMAYIGVALLVAFFTTLVHSVMKVRIAALVARHEGDLAWLEAKAPEFALDAQFRQAVHHMMIVQHIYNPELSPEEQVMAMIKYEVALALDPSVSKPAAMLINKAKREHGKKVRKAADRKLERTERDCEAQIAAWKRDYNSVSKRNSELRVNLGEIRAELTAFQSIVGQELENFVRLPSVRRKMIEAINLNHQAWKDL